MLAVTVVALTVPVLFRRILVRQLGSDGRSWSVLSCAL